MGLIDDLFEHFPIATYYYDAEVRFAGMNRLGEIVMGCPKEELIGKDAWSVIQADDAAKLRAAAALISKDSRRNYPGGECRVSGRPQSGKWTWVRAVGFTALNPEIHGYHSLSSYVRADANMKFQALTEALIGEERSVVESVLEACGATGHYAMSWHATAEYSGVGPFDVVSGVPWAHTAAVEAEVRRIADGPHVDSVLIPAAGLLDGTPEVMGTPVLAGVVHPVRIGGVVAAVLIAWTFNSVEDGIGWAGADMLLRNARLVGLAIEGRMKRAALEPVRQLGPWKVDRDQRFATNGRTVKLSPTEMSILLALGEFPGRAVSREQINLTLFGSSFVGGSRACDVHIKNLRQKLGAGVIETVHGHGYALSVR